MSYISLNTWTWWGAPPKSGAAYAKETIIRKRLQAKFKYICIEQNRKYLYSVVINKNGRKLNL